MIWKIYAKWILICLGIGLIPVLMLGASQGGIALSPIIIVFSVIVGFSGGAIHSVVYSIRHGSKSQKILSYVIAVFVALFVTWLIYSSNTCNINEDYANERVRKHVVKHYKLDTKYLGSPTFTEGECKYSYEYESPTKRYQFIVTSYGEVHTWDYEAHGL